MEIKRSLARDGTFAPGVMNFLRGIPDQCLFHDSYNMRHPESTYSLAVEKVGNTFLKVAGQWLRETEDFRAETPAALQLGSLLEKFETFLHAVQEHVDCCWQVLKTFINPQSARGTEGVRFADQYVLKNGLPGAKSFKDGLGGYRQSLVVNRLKHNCARLRGVAILAPEGARLGYFLEEPTGQGQIGPSPAVDRDAFSFAYSLLWHLFNVYSCSESLAQAAVKAVGGLSGLGLKRTLVAPSPLWSEVGVLASRIPLSVFPKENRAASFRVDGGELTARFPVSIETGLPSTFKVMCATVVDGHTPRFRAPRF